MTKDELFYAKQAEMPANTLADLVQKEISNLCKTGGRSLTMTVPPMVTDTDMLLCEMLRRFKKLQEFKDYVHQRLDKAGIEKEPNGEHSQHGCRIGDRLDIALNQYNQAMEDLVHSFPSNHEIEGCYDTRFFGCTNWCGDSECSGSCSNAQEHQVLNREKLMKLVKESVLKLKKNQPHRGDI